MGIQEHRWKPLRRLTPDQACDDCLPLSSSPTPKLAVTLDGAVATMAVDNPAKRNAFDLEMWWALPPIMEALDQDERVRAIVLRGAGTTPSRSGADISGVFGTVGPTPRADGVYEAANEAAFWAVAHCGKPVIAQIRGFCLGGGFGLALACDMQDRRRGRGLRHSGGPARSRLSAARHELRGRVGRRGSEGPVLHRPPDRRREAQRLGVVQRVIPDSELDREAALLARTIASNAP